VNISEQEKMNMYQVAAEKIYLNSTYQISMVTMETFCMSNHGCVET